MKNLVINGLVKFISKYNCYSDIKIEELKYGLISIYLLITKLIIILILSVILGIFKEVIIFSLCFIPIRSVSFGLHANKSWICLVSSILFFIGLPWLSTILKLPGIIKTIFGSILIIFIFKNSPADTKKRPIVNPKRRLFFKYSSVLIAIIYCALSLTLNNNFIANCLLFALLIQNLLISPTIYKLFDLPYDNYKNFNMV